MLAVLTGHTCSFACWEAREDVCRCSCGGANHGCLRRADGVQPVRMAKLDGVMRELHAVGNYGQLHDEAVAMNEAAGITYFYADSSRNAWDRNIPARIRMATKDQVAKWPELTAYRGSRERPYLLWTIKAAVPELASA